MSIESPRQPLKLKYNRFTIVNINNDGMQTPYLCVIVEDDENFKLLKSDEHKAVIITDSGKPVKGGKFVPLTLTVTHSYPVHSSDLNEVADGDDSFTYSLSGEQSDTFSNLMDIGDIEGSAEVLLQSLGKINDDEQEEDDDDRVDDSDEHSDEIRYDLNSHRGESCIDESFTIEVPSAFISMSNLIYEQNYEDAPAFLMVSRSSFSASKAGKGYSMSDFDVTAEYEDVDSEDYGSSVAEIVKIRNGAYSIDANMEQMGAAATIVMDLIIRISNGETDALQELGKDFINHLGRLTKKEGQSSATAKRPAPEDSLYHIMLNMIIDLYEATSTEELFNTLYDGNVLDGFEDTVEDLERQTDVLNDRLGVGELLQQDDLKDLFSGIEIEEGTPTIPEEAKEVDLSLYYSIPLSPSSFPESMKPISDSLVFDFMYENDILNNDVIADLTVTDDNAASVCFSMIVSLAVRLARMREMENYGVPFIGLNVFLKMFQDKYGSTFNNVIVNSAITNIPIHGLATIRQFCSSHLPKTKEERINSARVVVPGTDTPLILTFPIVKVLHNLFHVIQDLSIEEVFDALSDVNPIREVIEYFYEKLEEQQESSMVAEGSCAELLMTVDYIIGSELSNEIMTDSIIELLLKVAKISVTHSVGLDSDTDEWKSAMFDFFAYIVEDK